MKTFSFFWVMFISVLSFLQLEACSSSGSPVPPQDIPLAGSIGSIIEIPYASDPITTTSLSEISSDTNSIINLQYFQNDDEHDLATIFDTNTSEATCVHSWIIAKAINNSGNSDNVLCIFKRTGGIIENQISDLYDGNDHIVQFNSGDGITKAKIKFDGTRTGDTLSNITSFSLHVCEGPTENDLTQSAYTQYTRTSYDGTYDHLYVTNIKLDSSDNTKLLSEITTFSNASLEQVESKSVHLQYYNPWSESGGGIEFGDATITIGYENVVVNGYANYTAYDEERPVDRSWQISSVGALKISDYDNYNLLADTFFGDGIANFIIDQGTQNRICFNSSTTQAEECPNDFFESDALTMPPDYQDSLTITLTSEQEWDCSGNATEINLLDYQEEIETQCADYSDTQYSAQINCNYLWL